MKKAQIFSGLLHRLGDDALALKEPGEVSTTDEYYPGDLT